ncbi:MAG: hypothetical protein KGQ59_00890 [Bdellovibrionales bacterium]|nr:hypothetical protein [Bdellovibrionales bacterium]
MISETWALQATLRFVAFSVFIQSLEMIAIRSNWQEAGPWAWSRIRQEFRPFGAAFFWVLDRLLQYRGYFSLIVVQTTLCVSCMLFPDLRLAPPIFILVFLGCLRWRGAFNGGSDYMTVLVLLALSVAACFGGGKITSYALGYIGMQVVASYFVAGLVKIKQAEWRSGHALRVFLGSSLGQTSPWVRILLSRQSFSFYAAWAVMLFELFSPAILILGRNFTFLFFWISAAFLFHLANAFTLGLNRFVWAWLAGYFGLIHLISLLNLGPP